MSQQVLDSLSSALPQISSDRPSDDEFDALMSRIELRLSPSRRDDLEQEFASVRSELGADAVLL